jgi:acyl-coenzyme A thioesterase PaaI-like protein
LYKYSLMDKFNIAIEKARKSNFQLWILNTFIGKFIPFNGPHKYKIVGITDDGFEIEMPYIKKNLNHLKGLHACGLATLSELIAGLTLIRKLGFKEYRLIMQELKMDYYYQAKMPVRVKFELTDDFLKTNLKDPLTTGDAVFVEMKTEVYDLEKNHICTGTTKWQVKKWTSVKTKV